MQVHLPRYIKVLEQLVSLARKHMIDMIRNKRMSFFEKLQFFMLCLFSKIYKWIIICVQKMHIKNNK